MPVRNYTGDRLPSLLDFVEAIRGWDDQGRDLGRLTFQEALAQPDSEPAKNCYLLEEEGKVQGFCLVIPELPISRTVLEFEVAPHLSGSSQERALLRRGMDRARELGAWVSHLCIPDSDQRAALLEAEGFVYARAYWDMVWDHEALPQWQVPEGFTVRSFQHWDASLLTEVQNSAFEGSWGFCPNTVEQIGYRASMANTSHPGIVFLYQDEKPAGYCWTCVAPANGSIRGLIGMIGVVPDYRGKGVSRAILMAGMEYLRSK